MTGGSFNMVMVGVYYSWNLEVLEIVEIYWNFVNLLEKFSGGPNTDTSIIRYVSSFAGV